MMNKQIRRMIDEIFSEMKMTAENLALRDELMANAQERFEDAVRQGKTEEEAFAEVASSLGDVQSLLKEMNGEPENAAAPQDKEEAPKQPKEAPKGVDVGDALNKAFSALGDFGRQIVPQTKKIVRQVDDVTGGVIGGIGKAVNKGVRDAQKAAGEAIDRFSGDKGEIVIDFGKKDDVIVADGESPASMREEAEDLRAQAQLKRVVGDEETARQFDQQADALCAKADAIEQELAMEQARRDAQQAAEADAREAEPDAARDADFVTADGEVDEEAFAKAVDQMAKDAEAAAAQSGGDGWQGQYTMNTFPAAGLRTVDVSLDSDDVTVKPGEGSDVEVLWESESAEDAAPVVTMDGHRLTIRRPNPDVFKTFFSVFKKEGGKVTVRVPLGYAADYVIGTTSGDIRLYAVDVDSVKVNTTSGDVRLEPDAGVRAKDIDANTVSGDVTVSACAESVKVNTVSGDQFVSCDVNKVDVNTVSGDVHVEGACEDWEVNSVSGSAALLCTVVPSRKIQIGTMSGSARVALPGDIRGFVADMSSMSGSVTNEFGPNRYGTCALPIHMDTVSGSLMITRL